jgi:hypothetical protein
MNHPLKMHLMKYAKFEAVDYQLLIQFLQNLEFRETHIELFENLKSIFSFQQEFISMSRWQNAPTFLSLNQFQNFMDLLNSLSVGNMATQEKIQTMFFNYKEFEIQIGQMKKILKTEITKKITLENQLEQINSNMKELQIKINKLNAANEEKKRLEQVEKEIEERINQTTKDSEIKLDFVNIERHLFERLLSESTLELFNSIERPSLFQMNFDQMESGIQFTKMQKSTLMKFQVLFILTNLQNTSNQALLYEKEKYCFLFFPASNSLGDSCFRRCQSFTIIHLPDSISSLGKYCFGDCTSLTTIFLPNLITSLSNSCFR